MKKTATPIGSCLSTLLDDSSRMAPFVGTIFQNFETRSNSSMYLSSMISTFTTGIRAKKVSILCLENCVDPDRFIKRCGIQINSNVTVLQETAHYLSAFDKFQSEFTSESRAENVLIIDSLIPLLLSSNEEFEKTTKKILLTLKKLQSQFSHIIVLHSTDIILYDRVLESSLKQFSNATLDFRRESGIDSGVQCLLPESDGIHVHITVKKKHPRTHLKVSSQHEHFQIDSTTFKISKFFSGPQVQKKIDSILAPESHVTNDSSATIDKIVPFSLSLKESEQKAKDNLVLPFMRTPEESTKPATESSGGQVIYHYDKFDDFDEDEDDPDDDLDF